jgi:hypothetical protein
MGAVKMNRVAQKTQAQSRASSSYQKAIHKMSSSVSPSIADHRHGDIFRTETDDTPPAGRVPVRLTNNTFALHGDIVALKMIGAV